MYILNVSEAWQSYTCDSVHMSTPTTTTIAGKWLILHSYMMISVNRWLLMLILLTAICHMTINHFVQNNFGKCYVILNYMVKALNKITGLDKQHAYMASL